MLKDNDTAFHILFHVLDPAIVVGVSAGLHRLGLLVPVELAKLLAVYAAVLTGLIFSYMGLYRSRRGQSLMSEARLVLSGWLVVLLAFNAVIMALAGPSELDALWPLGLFKVEGFWLWAGCVASGIVAARWSMRLALRSLRRRGINLRHAVIVGAGEMGTSLARYLMDNPWIGIQVQGLYDDRLTRGDTIRLDQTHALPVLGTTNDCLAHCHTDKPDMVMIALPMRASERITQIVWTLGTRGIQVLLIPDLITFGLQRNELIQMGDFHVVAFNLFPRWKRIFDLVMSSLVLVALSPLLALIALLIFLEDGGPALYGHRRIGENGRAFRCLKFRTMHKNADARLRELLQSDPALKAEWDKSFKLKNDPRVTRIGRFLRRTSLDELPQFLNVLKGEMSVVGARPIVTDEFQTFYKDVAIAYCAMKPGITGPWQSGSRSDIEDYQERVKLDQWYVFNASLWLDIQIILKTALKMLTCKGAY